MVVLNQVSLRICILVSTGTVVKSIPNTKPTLAYNGFLFHSETNGTVRLFEAYHLYVYTHLHV